MKVLTVIDGSTREALAARPAAIGNSTVPMAAASELTEWLEAQGAATHRIEPGKPWQNSFAAPLNSRVCDECLGMNGFWSIEHPRVALEAWRTEFNTEHPHSSLGCLTAKEFAASWSAMRSTRLPLKGGRRP